MPMKDYDLTHKSMAVSMCPTYLKEMGIGHSVSSPVTVGELTKWGIAQVLNNTAKNAG